MADKEDREIIVEGNLLRYVDRFGRTGVMNFDKVEYVYLEMDDKNESTLFCFDSHQHHIPVDSKGFDKVFYQLPDQLGFGDYKKPKKVEPILY